MSILSFSIIIKVSEFQNVFLVSSISPKKWTKELTWGTIIYSKVEFVLFLFFGRIEMSALKDNFDFVWPLATWPLSLTWNNFAKNNDQCPLWYFILQNFEKWKVVTWFSFDFDWSIRIPPVFWENVHLLFSTYTNFWYCKVKINRYIFNLSWI